MTLVQFYVFYEKKDEREMIDERERERESHINFLVLKVVYSYL